MYSPETSRRAVAAHLLVGPATEGFHSWARL
jgi:hypothetical protein